MGQLRTPYFSSRSIFITKQMANSLKMPIKTTRQYFEKLVQADILCEIPSYVLNQIFRADEIFNALDNIQK